VPESVDPAERLVRHVLDRAHGRLTNVWRDGLVALTGLSKPDAAARVAEFLPGGGPIAPEADATLIEIPRHRLAPLFAAIRASV